MATSYPVDTHRRKVPQLLTYIELQCMSYLMTTHSPLEEQISQWRLYLRRRAIHGPEVEELEGRLRDQMALLTGAGLDGDEAFLIAVKRMGSLDALSREFSREHSQRLWKQLLKFAREIRSEEHSSQTHTPNVI